MSESLLLVRGRALIPVPRTQWEQHVHRAPAHHGARQAFMTPDHHRVRYYVVRALAAHARPLSVAALAAALALAPAAVETILADLERNLFFLVRNPAGEVSWAFPVTADPTPHRITFDNGEAIYAA
jgi:hypothetical protein